MMNKKSRIKQKIWRWWLCWCFCYCFALPVLHALSLLNISFCKTKLCIPTS